MKHLKLYICKEGGSLFGPCVLHFFVYKYRSASREKNRCYFRLCTIEAVAGKKALSCYALFVTCRTQVQNHLDLWQVTRSPGRLESASASLEASKGLSGTTSVVSASAGPPSVHRRPVDALGRRHHPVEITLLQPKAFGFKLRQR